MAKAASPVRLQKSLVDAATVAGQQFNRSTAEQIEYWADLGRRVAAVLDPLMGARERYVERRHECH